ncbi:MAG: RNA polymerase sigma factor [Bacteroidetes bacterium]|nr:MAG: RNA polymerase sigma factor [Bacteroidota bacterium]
MTPEAFHSLKEKIQRGDPSGLKLVFEECGRYCVRTLISQTGCAHDDAEDILMEAMISFRENMVQGKIAFISSLRSYVYAICRNKWMDLQRARQRWQRETSSVEQSWYFLAEEESDWLVQAEEDAHTRQRISLQTEAVRWALDSLKEACRQILTYFYVEQRSMDEIAEMLGLAGANVAKVTKFRCFRRWTEAVALRLQAHV